MAAVALLCLCTTAWAQNDGPRVSEDPRYDLFKCDGKVYRFDRQTGEFLEIVMTKEGPVGVAMPMRVVTKAPIRAKDPGTQPTIDPTPSEMEPAILNDSRPKPVKGAAPVLLDDQGNDVTDQPTDIDRDGAKGIITAYQGQMSLSQVLDIGDRITGNVLVRNMGDKKLRALELTLMIPVVGREKPDEQRFLFLDKPGRTAPPQPGKESMALIQKVDLPCPAGGVKGSPYLKVSYLKFAE
jgi:hypothetical protein